MEVNSRDGGCGQTGSYSSGTIVSTTYYCTSSGSGSHLSSGSMAAAAVHVGLGLHDDDDHVSWGETEAAKTKHITSLVQEFFAASSSAANCSIRGGDVDMGGVLVVERWLTELGVGWVLHLPSASSTSAWERDHRHTSDAGTSWIRAFREIVDTVGFTESLFPDRSPMDVNMRSVFEEEEEAEAESSVPDDQLQFARFIQETMLKMLSFVDVIATVVMDPNPSPNPNPNPNPNGLLAVYQTLNVLLRVHGALSDALSEMEVSFLSTASPEVELIGDAMFRLLYAKDGKARDAIWSTMERIRARILLEGIQTPHETSNIHKVTRSVMGHINFLLDSYWPLHPIVSEAAALGKYVPQIGGRPHLDNMALEITSCLEEKIANISESFPDQGLRFLFLLNNSDFMREKLQGKTLNSSLQVHVAALFSKVERYMERYLQVSWALLLSCLFNPTPLCLFGNSLTLPKFESEFQKTYTTQKLWKVPDPELRTGLRRAIIDKIIPVYTKYVEDNKTINPKFTPQELEEMLQELFEG